MTHSGSASAPRHDFCWALSLLRVLFSRDVGISIYFSLPIQAGILTILSLGAPASLSGPFLLPAVLSVNTSLNVLRGPLNVRGAVRFGGGDGAAPSCPQVPMSRALTHLVPHVRRACHAPLSCSRPRSRLHPCGLSCRRAACVAAAAGPGARLSSMPRPLPLGCSGSGFPWRWPGVQPQEQRWL